VLYLPCRVYLGAPLLGAPFSPWPDQFPNYQPAILMGRSYWFECSRCGYRTKVSGRADRGFGFFVQTIVCRDCKELYDAVTRVRVPDESGPRATFVGSGAVGFTRPRPALAAPPRFEAVLNRLPYRGIKRFRWVQFKIQCPVSAFHRVHVWNELDKCPRCGVYLERNALAYRIWD
jgi:hypothetical protein